MNVETRTPLTTSSSSPQVRTAPDDEWVAAAQRVARRRHRTFKIYAGALVAVNALVVASWGILAISGHLDLVKISLWPGQPPLPEGFFWPVIPIAICGVLVWMSARRAYPREGYPDAEVAKEIARSGGQSPATYGAAGSAKAAGGPAVPPRTRQVPPRPSVAPSKVHVQRRGFAVHLIVYAVVSAVLATAWALGGGGFFWPAYLMTVWGLGVLVNAYLAYRPRGDRRSGRGDH